MNIILKKNKYYTIFFSVFFPALGVASECLFLCEIVEAFCKKSHVDVVLVAFEDFSVAEHVNDLAWFDVVYGLKPCIVLIISETDPRRENVVYSDPVVLSQTDDVVVVSKVRVFRIVV